MTNDWKKSFFEMARIAFDESMVESSTERILSALKKIEEQEAVIDFLEGLFNDDDFDDEERQMLVPYFIEKAKEGIKAKQRLLELEAAIQIKEIEEREASKEKNLGTVGTVVETILKKNMSQYPIVLARLIPKGLLTTKLTNENLHEMGTKIDEIRFKIERELAKMLNIEDDTAMLSKVINGEKGVRVLTQLQKQMIKKIKFLNNVAQVIIHQ